MPTDLGVYGATNPPLYYWVAAKIYQVFRTDKSVQLFSWVLYVINILLFRVTLSRFKVRRLFANLVALFYALMPLTICYGIMILNYTLANFLMVVVLYLYARVIEDARPSHGMILALIAASLGAVFSSMSGLAALCTTFVVLLFLMNRPLAQRKRYAALMAGVSLLVYGTYLFNRSQQINCTFCTKHRNVNPWLDHRQYLRVSGQASIHWRKPYYPNGFKSSIPLLMLETYFADYFNYLAPRHLWSNPEKRDWDYVGPYFVDPLRRYQMVAQTWLGVPLLFAFLYACWLRWKTRAESRQRPHHALRLAYLVFCGLTVFQFVCYFLQYREWLAIHAGYLYPISFIGCLLMAGVYGHARLRESWKSLTVGALMIVYSLLNVWTFWI
jgi:4-amino-4-deoxy-L-arabinose transferase-like glycosyltransferase